MKKEVGLSKKKEVKKRSFPAIGILITLLILTILGHATTHFIVYKTSIPLLETIGVSGLVIQNVSSDVNLESQLKEDYPKVSFISKIALIGEWSLLILLIVFSATKKRIHLKKEETSIRPIVNKDNSKTDIDLLYDLLKREKNLRVSTAAKLLNVNKETVEAWGEILENGDLATLNYPRFGEPEITLTNNE